MIPNRKQTAQVDGVPAPVGGLNARDSYAAMPPTDAVVMNNIFPAPSYVGSRNGSLAWATGMTGAVPTVCAYTPASGNRKLFGVANNNVFDCTTKGAVGAAVVSAGITSNWWQHVNFAAGGAQYLVMVNGQDNMLIYNGATWQAVTSVSSPIAITGATTSNFINVNVFQGRLFFVQENSMVVYFLPILSIGGAAVALDLSSQTTLGGYIVTMATWTVETTSGMTQMACFITSEGEVLVYQGNDPTYASSWYQVGTFRIGHPIGYRCTRKYGSDVAVICADGLVPLSKAMMTDRSQKGIAISDKIQNLVNNDVASYGANQGWDVTLFPLGNKLILNVPNSSTTAYQYVMNTLNQSWCIFTGWNAHCFEVMLDQLFYGGYGTVYQADVGYSDNNNQINCVAIQAPNYFGSHQQKQFMLARPIINATGIAAPSFQINTDYNFTTPTNTSGYVSNGFSQWNTSPWDSTPWSVTAQIYKNWVGVNGVGYTGSPSIAFSTSGAQINWQATDVTFQLGSVL